MTEERKPFRGDEIEKIKSIKSLKTPMINLFRTYPVYQWYGIIETYFKGELGNEVVDILDKDGLIKIKPDTHPRVYRLTPKGIDFAISMINLEHSEEIRKFTKALIIIGGVALLLGLNQLIFQILQFFK